MTEPTPRRFDLLPIVILLAIVGIVCVGFWLFPYIQSMVEHSNCVGIGRTDCG